MPSEPNPNVKIYDRPVRKGPSPIVLAVVALVLLAAAFFAYRTFHHAAPAPARFQTGWTRPGALPPALHVRVGGAPAPGIKQRAVWA